MQNNKIEIHTLEKFIAMHGTLEKAATKINNGISKKEKPYTKSSISHWINNNRRMSDEVFIFVKNQVFQKDWGSIYILLPEEQPFFFDVIKDLITQGKFEGAIDIAIRCQAAGDCDPEKKENPAIWAYLAAIIGCIYRDQASSKDITEAQKYKLLEKSAEAFEDANSLADNLLYKCMAIRYKTNCLSIRREIEFHKCSKDNKNSKYLGFVREVFTEQDSLLKLLINGIIDKETEDTIVLVLRHLLRISSLLNDETSFSYYLKMAQKREGFGATPEERDASLKKQFDKRHDSDNDFENARSYKCVQELSK